MEIALTLLASFILVPAVIAAGALVFVFGGAAIYRRMGGDPKEDGWFPVVVMTLYGITLFHVVLPLIEG